VRSVAALVVVIACVAGATATAGLLQVKQIVNVINTGNAISTKHITPPAPGQPETLLLIGVDHRYGEGVSVGNTDTLILVRINDSSSTINVLSIPRDLGVQIPGVGFSKINAAYADGGKDGGNLLVQTLQQDVFPGLQVNHILVTDFQSFANLISALGCVYSDVDHRYYNNTLQTGWSSIDIQPGYQQLCGGPHNDGGPTSALAFVRFRHNDSDLVRESRQQDFLRWAKGQVSAAQLLANRTKLLDDFAKDVQSDAYLHSTDGVVDLFDLAYNADGGSIKSIPFPAGPGATSAALGDYLTFSQTASAQAYSQFMTATPPATTTTATTPAKSKRKKAKRKRFIAPAYMEADVSDGNSQSVHLGANPGLPVYFPKQIPEGYEYCFTLTEDCLEPPNPPSEYDNSYPRHYTITNDGKAYPSYVFTLVEGTGNPGDLGTGDYFTVQGTTWQSPPILDDPTSVKMVNGKLLAEYSQGGDLTLVAWHTKQAVYWISNSIQSSIPNDQMVAMAATLMRGR
jgi:polyisoprenyl-teichoic acid--peptidoglycan teichoic acid transferase